MRLLSPGRPWGCICAGFARVSRLAVRRKIRRPSLCVLDAPRPRRLTDCLLRGAGGWSFGPRGAAGARVSPPFPETLKLTLAPKRSVGAHARARRCFHRL